MTNVGDEQQIQAPSKLEQEWHLASALRQRSSPPLLCSLLRLLDADGLMVPASQQIMLSHWASPLAALLPPTADHQRRVLRAVVLAAEQDGQEVCEELMQLYSSCLLGQAGGGSSKSSDASATELLPAPQPLPGWCYKLYCYAPGGEPVATTVQRLAALEQQAVTRCRQQQHLEQPPPPADEDASLEGRQHLQPAPLPAVTAGDGLHGLLALHVSLNLLEGGTGCHEWEAGFFLAEWVLSHPELARGRCCLEIGCGAGIVGVALHRAGASGITLTDGDVHTVANCRRNLQLNGVPLLAAGGGAGPADAVTCSSSGSGGGSQWADCRRLCWEDGWGGEPGSGAQQQQQPTLVLGADLLYDPTIIPVLLALLKQVLAAAAATAAAAAVDGGAADEAQEQQQQQQQQQQPAAYVATTLRNEATLMQFLAAAGSDPDICIQQMPEGANTEAPTAIESAAAGKSGNGGSFNCLPTTPICFQHLPELEAARGRIFLHRITLAHS